MKDGTEKTQQKAKGQWQLTATGPLSTVVELLVEEHRSEWLEVLDVVLNLNPSALRFLSSDEVWRRSNGCHCSTD